MMDLFWQGLNFVFVYIDDIYVLVASKDAHTHKVYLCQLFQHLKEYDLVINVSKRQFGVSTICIDFLSHHITYAGIQPLPDKVIVISQ